MVDAINYCHKSKKILHRDLKLDNIMIFEGKVKIIDFGFSIKIKDTKRDVKLLPLLLIN